LICSAIGGPAARCTKRTIINRLKEQDLLLAYKNGKEKGKLNLKALQWRHAQMPNSGRKGLPSRMARQ
jgi:hypothetical protein